ncbi:MAG: PqqD family protein [Methanomicrobiales archaeon]|nr:PqqD family protein [Methanomicrobiales archaeon]
MDLVTPESIVARSDDIVSREIEGELIIVPIASGIGDTEDELYTLNETGRSIWERIDGKRSLKNIADDLVIEYAAPLDIITRDVLGLVGELNRRKIVCIR